MIRVKENIPLVTGHKTRHQCCQDKDGKQKGRPSQREGAKHWDTLGMHHYGCKSKLNISCRASSGVWENMRTITIWLDHQSRHPPYYDVTLPPKAVETIREELKQTTPSEMARWIQIAYPNVSTKQVHKAWTTMSETLWKRDAEQILSAKTLLMEHQDDVDLLTIPATDGVEQVAWVRKKIMGPLRGKIVEIGIDATCKR